MWLERDHVTETEFKTQGLKTDEAHMKGTDKGNEHHLLYIPGRSDRAEKMTVAQQGDFEEAREARPFEAEFRRRIPLPGDLPPKCSNNRTRRLFTSTRSIVTLWAPDTPGCKASNARMIQLKTMLQCVDNSGATLVECVANLRMKRHGAIGDRIIVVVQKHRLLGEGGPGATSAASANKVRRGDIRHAIIVRTKKKYQRKDGMVVRFDDNACALIGKNGEPLGTRINGVVGAELRNKQQSKILSLASMHV